jgi:hypothetical protein
VGLGVGWGGGGVLGGWVGVLGFGFWVGVGVEYTAEDWVRLDGGQAIAQPLTAEDPALPPPQRVVLRQELGAQRRAAQDGGDDLVVGWVGLGWCVGSSPRAGLSSQDEALTPHPTNCMPHANHTHARRPRPRTSGLVLAQITIVVPAAVAIRAAVSLVTMPPVPHCVPVVVVSAVRRVMSSTTWMGVAVGSIWFWVCVRSVGQPVGVGP